jgi:hypothetical protein
MHVYGLILYKNKRHNFYEMTTQRNIFMLREGKRVMTVYHRQVPHVIGFKHLHDVKKALLQIDTRNSDRYVSIYTEEQRPKLILVKKPCVQFGKLHLDEVSLQRFFEYRDCEPQPLLLIVEHEIVDTSQYLLYESTILC